MTRVSKKFSGRQSTILASFTPRRGCVLGTSLAQSLGYAGRPRFGLGQGELSLFGKGILTRS